MNIFLNWARRIENIGVREDQPEQQQGAIRKLNLMCILMFLSTFAFVLVFFATGSRELGLLLATPLLFYFTILYLQHLGKYRSARILTILVLNVSVIFFSMVFPERYQLESVYFIYCGLQLLIFDVNSASQILLLFFLGLSSFILVEFPILPDLDLISFGEASEDPIPHAMDLILFIVFLVEMWLIFSMQERQKSELILAKEVAEDADHAKSEFLSTMSHEIRTPLNAVIGLTSLLDETPLNEEQQDFVSTVKMSGESLLTVINDILDYSKMEAGKLELEEEVFSVRSAVEDVLELMAPKAHEKSLELLFWVADDCAGGARGDVTRIRQILLNLLSNAIKFTDKGEVMVSVHWEKDDDSGSKHLLFSVQDTGIGIPQDRLHRLFQSFSQVDASTTRKYGGTGLGLAISKRLVEMMDGEIWAESEENVGTCFRFSLPLMPEVLETSSNWQRPSLLGKKVLILDDHAINLEMLSRTLGKWGLECLTYQSANQALAFLAEQKVDLVITDLCMPEMNGVDFVRSVRALSTGESPQLPIIMLSSSGNQVAEVDRQSLIACLNKPVRDTQLFRATSKGLEMKEVTHSKVVNPQAEQQTLTKSASKKLRILLTEDNAVNQKVATKMLEKLGYQADSAWNGKEAVTACERMDYDLILMDMNMPVMDGVQATQHIQTMLAAEGRPFPTIIAMTANVMMEHRETCLAAGMNDFLAKPVKLAELNKMIQTWFQESPQEVG